MVQEGSGLSPEERDVMMTVMGIETEDVEVEYSKIVTADGDELTVRNPDVTKIDVRGHVEYRITCPDDSAGVE